LRLAQDRPHALNDFLRQDVGFAVQQRNEMIGQNLVRMNDGVLTFVNGLPLLRSGRGLRFRGKPSALALARFPRHEPGLIADANSTYAK
jgi:hypothetical protein